MSDTLAKASRTATAQDVAEAAGVSVSAVSRTFTPGASVSPETRSRVLLASKRLSYQPNLLARSLSTSRSHVIGLVMGDIRNPYYPEVVDEFTRRLATLGFRVMLLSVWGDVTVDDVASSILQSRMDGVIIASVDEADRLGEICHRAGMVVVLFNRSPTTSEALSSVRSDNVEGGRSVANFVVDGGYKRPAFMVGVEHITTSRDREVGFTGRLDERGVRLCGRAVGHYTYEGGRDAAIVLMRLPEPPDVIFCANDIMAIGAIDGLRAGGFAIPSEIAVIGFDDIAPAAWPPYDLTTVHQDRSALTTAAVDTLLRQIQSGERARHVELLPVQIIQRGSTRPQPIS